MYIDFEFFVILVVFCFSKLFVCILNGFVSVMLYFLITGQRITKTNNITLNHKMPTTSLLVAAFVEMLD